MPIIYRNGQPIPYYPPTIDCVECGETLDVPRNVQNTGGAVACRQCGRLNRYTPPTEEEWRELLDRLRTTLDSLPPEAATPIRLRIGELARRMKGDE